jgi:S-adenosylmethionine hydrolase
MAQLITLTTDFGTGDTYTASMKGVILTINPEAVIVDICHFVEPQNILQATFLISTVHKYFPAKTIHLVIVDPEVGSQRKAILLKTPSAYFLAPDSGVLSYIINELEPTPPSKLSDNLSSLKRRKACADVEAIAITNDKFWRYPVNHSFHGRDVFAPVAAHLSLGTKLQEFRENVEHIHTFPIPHPYHDAQGNLVGHILHMTALAT